MATYGIDMGHSLSGAGSGASGYAKETDRNRPVGKRLIEMLKEKGHGAVNCAVDSASSVSNQLAGIVKKANAQKIDLFVSLHLNAYKKTTSAMGVETYYYSTSATGKNYASKVQNELVSKVGWKNRGIKTNNNLYVLKNTNAPAILVELGFCDSQHDMNLWNTETIARAIFKAITGTEYVPPAPPSSGGEFKIGDYNGNVIVTASSLNARSGRGTEHSVIGSLSNGQVTQVMYILPDDRDGKGDSALWGSIMINGKTGFIHLGYVKPHK